MSSLPLGQIGAWSLRYSTSHKKATYEKVVIFSAIFNGGLKCCLCGFNY
jgi:hypothetical protein